MPTYEARLYKTTGSTKQTWTLVDQIPFEAEDDEAARQIAPTLQVPKFDDSDMAIVFSPDGKTIWRLEP